jgi:hypothetical protein
MRISCYDPGFVPGTRVFVDGMEIQHAHTADEELGMVWGYDTNERGRIYLVMDEQTGERRVASRVWRGAVRIEVPDRAVER